jgi:hypothetical protein
VSTLTDREQAVILDALAAYSDRLREKGGWGIVPVARPAHFDGLEPMTTGEVEQLYEYLRAEWRFERQQKADEVKQQAEDARKLAALLQLLQKKKE